MNITNLFRRPASPIDGAATAHTTQHRGPWACVACRFWRQLASSEQSQVGNCIRHAPGVARAGEPARWPIVRSEDRCGEFKPSSPATQ